VADGDYKGNAGWNTSAQTRRLVNFDATGDAYGSTPYLYSSTSKKSEYLVPRAGKEPVLRPNGSSGGITALKNDKPAVNSYPNNLFNIFRSSSKRKCVDINDPAVPGNSHVFEIADDAMQLAVRTAAAGGTNAKPNLTKAELTLIYNGTYVKWGDIPGYTGPAPNNAIVPVIPQNQSGTYADFIKDVTGNAAPTTPYGIVAEEHDPAPFTSFPVTADHKGSGFPAGPADVIIPFSTGRWNMHEQGYFNTADTPAAPVNVSKAELQGGASLSAPTAGGGWWLGRKLYLIVRENDVNSTVKWQVGSTQNFVQALLLDNPVGADGIFFRPGSSSLYTSAGVIQNYVNTGPASLAAGNCTT
jgi:hypothetical protein